MAEATRAMAIRQQTNGDLEAASESLEHSAELFANALGPINTQTARCLYAAGLLGERSTKRREYLYRQAMAMYEILQREGTDHSDTILGCLSALGHCLTEQGRQDEAFEVCSRAIDVLEKLPPINNDVPPMLQPALMKLVNGGVLYDRLNAVCKATGRKVPQMLGFPDKKKQLWSLAITIAFFWFILGSIYTASAFLLLLLIHEMGHFLAARQVGVKVSPPIFTPVGAVIAMLSQPASAKDEAYFAIAGPVLGTVAAFAAALLSLYFGSSELCLASKFAFALNLFNLLPLAPMDGGRISMAISRKMWILGALLYAVIAFFIVYLTCVPPQGGLPQLQLLVTFPIKLFALYWVGWGAWLDYKERKKMAQMTPQYFKLPMSVRLAYSVAYIGLGAVLVCALAYMPDVPEASGT